MAELFELHDRNRYELIAFSFGPVADDPMRNRLKKAFDQFIDVRHVPDHDVVRLSRQMEIDIAIDLKGFTQDCRENLFVQRVAPVQVNYLGTPGTMGSTQWDYIIADKTVIPEDCQQYYAEQVVYLPHCYQVNDRKREVADRIFTRAELRLPDKGFIFCSFNNSYKILPETFSSWVRILQQVPGSVLWLLYDGEAAASNLRAEAQRRGIDDSRLIFAERIPSALYLARFRMADLFLDTFPCSAHTTASDALRSGVPLLTRMGRSFASRVAGSILHTLELPELITTTVEAFECRAVQLASAPVQLAEIKNKVAEAVRNSPLFDTAKFARHIEAAYSAMYERYQSGLPPISFAVQTVRDEAVAERP
jgi:predicted O-linked N-acetylglucosamine transferase (SPINDLY family)